MMIFKISHSICMTRYWWCLFGCGITSSRRSVDDCVEDSKSLRATWKHCAQKTTFPTPICTQERWTLEAKVSNYTGNASPIPYIGICLIHTRRIKVSIQIQLYLYWKLNDHAYSVVQKLEITTRALCSILARYWLSFICISHILHVYNQIATLLIIPMWRGGYANRC